MKAYLSGTFGQSYAGRLDRRYDMYLLLKNNLTVDYGNTIIYLDTEGGTIFQYIDYNSNSSVNGSFKNQIPVRDVYFNKFRTDELQPRGSREPTVADQAYLRGRWYPCSAIANRSLDGPGGCKPIPSSAVLHTGVHSVQIDRSHLLLRSTEDSHGWSR
jgi:hypothetical protein